MSEEKQGYMAELDEWTEKTILSPLENAWLGFYETPDQAPAGEVRDHLQSVEAEIKRAIREKVLDSYRNGQAAGPAKRPFRPFKPRQK